LTSFHFGSKPGTASVEATEQVIYEARHAPVSLGLLRPVVGHKDGGTAIVAIRSPFGTRFDICRGQWMTED